MIIIIKRCSKRVGCCIFMSVRGRFLFIYLCFCFRFEFGSYAFAVVSEEFQSSELIELKEWKVRKSMLVLVSVSESFQSLLFEELVKSRTGKMHKPQRTLNLSIFPLISSTPLGHVLGRGNRRGSSIKVCLLVGRSLFINQK